VRQGLPFREAHEAVGRLVRHADERGVEIGELSLEEMRGASPLFDEDARRIDLMSSLESRDVPGGTAPRRVAEALRRERERVQSSLAELEETVQEEAGPPAESSR